MLRVHTQASARGRKPAPSYDAPLPPPPPQALKPASTELSCLELHVALDLGDCNAMILGGRGKRFEFLVTGDFFG